MSNIKLDISKEDINQLIDTFVQLNLSEPSQEIYNEKLESDDVYSALGKAILNEQLINIIVQGVDYFSKDGNLEKIKKTLNKSLEPPLL